VNLFQLPNPLPEDELFEALTVDDSVLIERIVSAGQTTQPGTWLDQEKDEWVVLLQGNAEISFEDGRSEVMGAGDYMLIPAHCKHRVEFTSETPPCIWLAVHASLTGNRTQ